MTAVLGPDAHGSSQPPPDHPAVIVRRQRTRQKILTEKKVPAPTPDQSEVLQRTELCSLKGFRCWSECQMLMNFVSVRVCYVNGQQDCWGLMTTTEFTWPEQPREQYGLRTHVEERYRLLKCFFDLSDFPSLSVNPIFAQVVFILLSYTLCQFQLWRGQHEELAGLTPLSRQQRLMKPRSRWSFITSRPIQHTAGKFRA